MPVRRLPMAVSVVTGSQLTDSDSHDVADLSRLAPGLTSVNGGPSNLRLVMRGIHSVGEPTVGLYYDEIPVTGALGATNDAGGTTPSLRLFDVARVEVLRGPQGTMYGASALGGAVRVLYNSPVFEPHAALSLVGAAVQSGAPSYGAEAMVNTPLVADRLAVRVVAYNERVGGYVDHRALGRRDVNDADVFGGRVLVRYTPLRDVTIDGAFHHQERSGEIPLWNQGAGRYVSLAKVQRLTEDRFDLASLTSRWGMGGVMATSAVSYSVRALDQAGVDVSDLIARNIDNPAACERFRGKGAPCSPEVQRTFNDYVRRFVPGALYPEQVTRTTTAEFRFAPARKGRAFWTAGVFYSGRRTTVDNSHVAADANSGAIEFPLRRGYLRQIDDSLSQVAAFADASFRVYDGLSIEAGTRRFRYEREVGGETPLGLDLVNVQASPYTAVRSSEDGWVSRIALAYEVQPSALLYTSVSQGYRPGGVNQLIGGLPPSLAPYRSDRITNYETGLKTTFLDRKVSANVSAFLIDWQDMQVMGARPDGLFRFLSNAGAATVTGLEVEAMARLLPRLVVSAHGTLTRARLTEDQVNQNVLAPGKKGDRIPYVPEVTAGIAAQYTVPLSSSLNGFARFDASYFGPSTSELRPDNPFYRPLDGYGLVHARIGSERPDGTLGLYAFTSNLFNDVAVQSITANSTTVGQTLVTSAPPRTVGVNVRMRF